MCVSCDVINVDNTYNRHPVKMERTLVIKKDVINPKKLEYLCTWGGSVVDLDGFHLRLRKYREKMVYVQGQRYATVEVKYETKSGRLFGNGLCLQSMPSRVRNFILDDRMVDIDIVNSAPVIIQQVCKINNIETPCLDHFNLNYKRLLRDMNVTDTKKAKAWIFFGSVARKNEAGFYEDDNGGIGIEPGWMSALQTELEEAVFKKLKDVPRYEGLENEAIVRDQMKRVDHDITKRRRRNVQGEYVTNVKGIFLSLLYFKEETELMTAIDQIGRSHNLWDNRASMTFDGMIVFPKSGGVLSHADLDRISHLAYQETGIRVHLDFKPLDKKLDLDISKMPDERIVFDHHREAADMMLFFLGSDVCRDGTTTYAKRDGIWQSDAKEVQSFILRETSKANIHLKEQNKLTGEWEIKKFSCKTDHASRITKLVMADLPLREGFGRDLVLNSNRKLLFRNGYWEFLDEPDEQTGIYGRFVHGGTFDSAVMVPWDFPVDYNQEDIDFVKEKYFDDPFENAEDGLKENFMLALSRAMAGTPEKITNIVTGARNCGKSITFQWMKVCFGNYVGSINAGALIGKTSSDSARDNASLFETEHHRAVFVSELVSTDKSGKVELTGNGLKSVQSLKEGAVSGRRLYNNGRPFHSLMKMFILCNDVPAITPSDAYKMTNLYVMPNKFVTEDVLQMNRHQPTYKLANPQVERWYQEDRYREALTLLVLHSFRPHEVRPTPGMLEGMDIMEEEVASDVYDVKFVYTGNMNDRVDSKVAREIVLEHIRYAQHESIRREFTERILNVKPTFNPKNVYKPSNGKRWYCGVKIRTMADDQNPQGGGGGDDGYAPGFFPGR